MSFSATLIEKRDAALAKAEAVVSAAQADARELTAEEDVEITSALADVRSLDEQIEKHLELEKRSTEAAELRKEKKFDVAVGGTVVKSEARTYSPQAESSFIRDAFAAQFNNDYSAQQRLSRHMNEEKIERRDVTSANFAGLIVPQFLTELAAPFARAGRVAADLARKHQLPASGLTISLSKVTTGSATAEQTEGAAVQETNMDDTKLDISVVTIAGQQNVSRQSIERGTNIDSLVMADLVSSYNSVLNTAVVAELFASAGNAVTYTDASPTVAELYPKLVDSIQQVQTTFFAGPNVMIMHPRRLAFILAAVDDQKRPLLCQHRQVQVSLHTLTATAHLCMAILVTAFWACLCTQMRQWQPTKVLEQTKTPSTLAIRKSCIYGRKAMAHQGCCVLNNQRLPNLISQ
jgi:HK97 family phage major capsid protein